MAEIRIIDYIGVAKALEEAGFEQPKESLHDKKGKGIYRRHIFTVPAVEEGSPNQRIMVGESGGGSKRCRQFSCVGDSMDSMSIRMRWRSCHECEACMRLDPEDKANGSASPHARVDLCGPVAGEIIALEAESGSSGKVGTARSIPASAGIDMAKEVAVGEVVCAVVKSEPQPYCLGVVSAAAFKVKHQIECATGNPKEGDMVLQIRKLEPTTPAALECFVGNRLLNAHASCLRLRSITTKAAESSLDGVEKDQSKRTGTFIEGRKYQIERKTREEIWESMPQ